MPRSRDSRAGAEFPIVLLGQGDQKYAESWFTTDG